MRRKWIEEPDESEEVSSEDTQEYRVDEVDDEGFIEPEDDAAEYETFEDEEDDDADPEDDDLEEDEFYEDGEFVDDDFVDESGTERARPFGEPKRQYEPVAERLKAGWAAVVARAKEINLPELPKKSNKPEDGDKKTWSDKFDPKLAAGIAAIVLASLAVGIGMFFLGKGSGDDLDQATLEGQAAGKQAGAIKGAEGYATGFKKGRDAGFRKAYGPAYRVNFKKAFAEAGLDVPPARDIDVPEP